MQNIAHLEAQIEKELAELSKIQGVLADMKKPKTGGLADKENRTPQKRLERHTKVENSEKKKSALKPIESTRKYKRPPDPGALNMSNSKQTKKVVLMPETVHKPAGLTVKPEKSMPHVDQNEENVQEHAGPGLKLQALPIKKKARHPEERLSSQANKQIPGNVKETSDDDIIRTSELLRAFKNEDDDLRSSQIKPTETLKDKSTDIASDEKITKTQLPVPKSSKKVGRINSSRKRMSKERQSQGPLLDIKEKSVDELAHEQLERINREFRDARIKTKNFDDRVKLMVLEKETQEMMLKLIKKAKDTETQAKVLKECTFSPNLKIDYKHQSRQNNSRDRLEQDIYNRNLLWEVNKQSKLEGARVSKERIPEDCTFKPQTLDFDPRRSSNYPQELQKNRFQREALANYYYRMEKARSKSPAKPFEDRLRMTSGRDSAGYGISADRELIEKLHRTRHWQKQQPSRGGHPEAARQPTAFHKSPIASRDRIGRSSGIKHEEYPFIRGTGPLEDNSYYSDYSDN